MTLAHRLKPMLPPLLWQAGKDLKRRLFPSVDHYAYAPDGWQTRLPAGGGNDAYWSTFVRREREVCEALIACVRAQSPTLTPDDDMMKYLAFGFVLALAARHTDKLTVIDYGGNLGEYYWIGKSLVPGIELEFHCKELAAVAAAGREVSPDVIWHTDDKCLTRSYDLVMFSASLPYLPDWQTILQQAARAARGYLFLSDIPSVRHVPTFVITQRTGGVTHLQYLFNRSEIIDTVERSGLRLRHEFVMGEHPPVARAPEQPMSVGWLFSR